MPEARTGGRRRGRTTLLIAGAAVLGVVAGSCTGYLIQADREPTKLPSLSQPMLVQAKGSAPEALSASRDRRVKTDGDLRKLLLKKPAAAKDADGLTTDDGWLSPAAYADGYKKPGEAFGQLISDEFRRAVATGWTKGQATVEIQLAQFRQEEAVVAADVVSDCQYWANAEDSPRSWAVPGTTDGMAYVHDKPETEPGYLPVYRAESYAWRGDVVVSIWVYDTKPIPRKTIMELAERQMERL
ncbi:hypothetical protein OG426_25390 [Streptomyces canus]|uniref:hypothetical protein n=1 Tax=Streptomyces canus TaxID=58343 RepID=UPI00225534A9|nr:hypothetical protein [Streptomyces canus]MCX4859192.1 hypothetical protein [Streptomyces canus]WSW35571.1 hypothetical protein OG426_25390 [Streptomyces canus]